MSSDICHKVSGLIVSLSDFWVSSGADAVGWVAYLGNLWSIWLHLPHWTCLSNKSSINIYCSILSKLEDIIKNNRRLVFFFVLKKKIKIFGELLLWHNGLKI